MIKVWCRWLLLSFLLLGGSSVASPSLPIDNQQQQQTSAIVNLPNLDSDDRATTAANSIKFEQQDPLKLDTPLLVAKLKDWSANSLPAPKDFSTQALSRDSQFLRENLQTKPIYWLVVELNPPDPSIKVFTDLVQQDQDPPWYISAFQKSATRLSNWKDSNTLYASRRKFH